MVSEFQATGKVNTSSKPESDSNILTQSDDLVPQITLGDEGFGKY